MLVKQLTRNASNLLDIHSRPLSPVSKCILAMREELSALRAMEYHVWLPYFTSFGTTMLRLEVILFEVDFSFEQRSAFRQ